MEPKKNLKSDEAAERFRITQEIIECDNMIARMFSDNHLLAIWEERRDNLQFELEQLTDEL